MIYASRVSSSSSSTPTPLAKFSCDGVAYEVQRNKFYTLSLVSNGVSVLVKDPIFTDTINAMAYHPGEDYIYAIAQKANQNGYIIRIGAGYVTQIVSGGTISATTESVTSGTIDPDGYYWVAWTNAQAYAKIDMRTPGSASYGTVVASGSSNLLSLNNVAQYYTINDWASLGGADRAGKLYTVAGQFTSGIYKTHLLSLTTTAPLTWELVKTYDLGGGTNPTTQVTGKADWGAIYPSSDGYLYATENTTGRVYKFNLNNLNEAPSFVTQGPEGTTNDGARCVAGPIV